MWASLWLCVSEPVIYQKLIRCCSAAQSCQTVTPWPAARQASLPTVSWDLLRLMSASVMPSDHLILCRPLLLPSVFPNIWVFSNASALHIRWPKCWSFSFSISPSDEYSALTSVRMGLISSLQSQNFIPENGTKKESEENALSLASLAPLTSDQGDPVSERCHSSKESGQN